VNTKSIFFCLVFGVFCSLAHAQNNSLGKNDPDAKKVLDGLSAKLKSFKAVQCGFTLTVADAKDKVQGSKNGTIQIKGNKYHISVVGGQDIFCDGKDVWTYDKGTNEVTITKSDPNTQTLAIDKIFTNFYDKDFLYKLNGESTIAGHTVQEVELTPTDKSKSFFKAFLYIDKTLHTLASIKWIDKSNSKFTLTTKNLNGNAAITDAQLAYNKSKFPGAEEVDLRN
jgi:outer membrane lipoprotein-sorting protein